MLRIVIQTSDCSAAANVGGPVYTDTKTFTVCLPEVEEYLRAHPTTTFSHRQVIGVEILGGKNEG